MTPGEWTIENDVHMRGYAIFHRRDSQTAELVARVYTEDNAHAIKAVPRLVQACRAAREHIGRHRILTDDPVVLEAADAANAVYRALGEALLEAGEQP